MNSSFYPSPRLVIPLVNHWNRSIGFQFLTLTGSYYSTLIMLNIFVFLCFGPNTYTNHLYYYYILTAKQNINCSTNVLVWMDRKSLLEASPLSWCIQLLQIYYSSIIVSSSSQMDIFFSIFFPLLKSICSIAVLEVNHSRLVPLALWFARIFHQTSCHLFVAW